MAHMDTKHKMNLQLTRTAHVLLAALANQLDMSQSAVVEQAIREKAKREGVS